MPSLAARHQVEIERDAEVALGAHLDRRAGQPRGPHVLDGDDAVLRHDLEAGLEQELFGERIAHLHGRALLLRILAELGRRHGGAVDAVAAGLGAEIDDRLSDPGRGGIENLGRVGDPDRHGVDQAIAVVAAVKADRAAHRRHPEGISVAADAGDHAGHQVPGPGCAGSPKRRKSRQAIGRAPMVNTSRRMPPTPVVAP